MSVPLPVRRCDCVKGSLVAGDSEGFDEGVSLRLGRDHQRPHSGPDKCETRKGRD